MNEGFRLTYVAAAAKPPLLLLVLNSPWLYFAVSILGNLVPGKLRWFFYYPKGQRLDLQPPQNMWQVSLRRTLSAHSSQRRVETVHENFELIWAWNCQINTGKVNCSSLTFYFSVLFKVVFFFFLRQWGPWLDDTVGPGSLLRSTHPQGFFLCPSTPTWPWPKMASPLGTTWRTRKSARVSLERCYFLRQHEKRINALTSSLSQPFTVAIPSAWSRERSQMTRSRLRPVSTMNGGCRDKPAWISTTTDGRPTKTATENTSRWGYSFNKWCKTGSTQK